MAAAQDPGGAEALAPVLLRLGKHDNICLDILTRGRGASVLQRDGLSFKNADLTADEQVFDKIYSTSPDLVITATSLKGTLERTMIAAARSINTPSLALLDSWTNYSARFASAQPPLTKHLPDVIAVPDDLAKDEMCMAGLPAERVQITGQPAFDVLKKHIAANDRFNQENLRAELAVAENQVLVVFFSQPIRRMYGDPSGDTGRGYDELSAINCLAETLLTLNCQVKLVVKTHPLEDPDTIRNFLGTLTLPVTLMDRGDPDTLMMAADVVCGMTTIMLVRAWLVGRQIISIQPGLRGVDALSLARAGHVTTVVNAHSLGSYLIKAIAAGPKAPPITTLTDGKATKRVAQLAMSLAMPSVSHKPK